MPRVKVYNNDIIILTQLSSESMAGVVNVIISPGRTDTRFYFQSGLRLGQILFSMWIEMRINDRLSSFQALLVGRFDQQFT